MLTARTKRQYYSSADCNRGIKYARIEKEQKTTKLLLLRERAEAKAAEAIQEIRLRMQLVTGEIPTGDREVIPQQWVLPILNKHVSIRLGTRRNILPAEGPNLFLTTEFFDDEANLSTKYQDDDQFAKSIHRKYIDMGMDCGQYALEAENRYDANGVYDPECYHARIASLLCDNDLPKNNGDPNQFHGFLRITDDDLIDTKDIPHNTFCQPDIHEAITDCEYTYTDTAIRNITLAAKRLHHFKAFGRLKTMFQCYADLARHFWDNIPGEEPSSRILVERNPMHYNIYVRDGRDYFCAGSPVVYHFAFAIFRDLFPQTYRAACRALGQYSWIATEKLLWKLHVRVNPIPSIAKFQRVVRAKIAHLRANTTTTTI